jgi:hypothetical protein
LCFRAIRYYVLSLSSYPNPELFPNSSINYASSLCNPWANPGDVAISINPKLREKVKAQAGRCGTVLMDFPSDDDIKALISKNDQ